MPNQRIRIRLTAFDHRLSDQSAAEIVDTARVRLQQLWEENAYLKQMLASSPHDHDDRQQ